MAVLRKEKKNNFTVIDNAIFKDRRLSFKAKGLLCQMLSLPDGWEYSVKGLATLASDKYSAITSGLKELEEAGYFRREQLYDKGKFAGYEYIISETPTVKNSDFPFSENPISENTISENPTQLNTKELNTKELNTKTIEQVISQLPDDLKDTAMRFVEHRKKLKAPMTGYALELAIKKAKKLAHDDIDTTIDILEQSIMNGWKGVFEFKESKSGNPFLEMLQKGDYQ